MLPSSPISSSGCCGWRHRPAPPEAVATTVSGVEAITHTARLGYLQRQSHALGDVVMASDDAAVALTYFRNNVLHCFALPGLIACLIVQHGVIGKTKLARLSRELYVLLESELYLPPWRAESVASAPVTHDDGETGDRIALAADAALFPPFERTLATMASDGWVSMEADADVVSASPAGTDAAMHLELLAATIRPALTRHALMLALAGRPSGEQSREAVESLCQRAAQHLAMTHVFNARSFRTAAGSAPRSMRCCASVCCRLTRRIPCITGLNSRLARMGGFPVTAGHPCRRVARSATAARDKLLQPHKIRVRASGAARFPVSFQGSRWLAARFTTNF